MVQNAAKKLEQPLVDNPDQGPRSRNSVQQAIKVNSQAVPFSHLEKLAVVGIGLVSLVMTICLISIRTDNSQQLRQIQDFSNKTQMVVSQNTNLRQEISELNSSSRLLKIAKEHHFTLQANNIRNISK